MLSRIRINPMAILGGLALLGLVLSIPSLKSLEEPRVHNASPFKTEKAGF